MPSLAGRTSVVVRSVASVVEVVIVMVRTSGTDSGCLTQAAVYMGAGRRGWSPEHSGQLE